MNRVAIEVEVDVVGHMPQRLPLELDREEVVAEFALALVACGRFGQPPQRAGACVVTGH